MDEAAFSYRDVAKKGAEDKTASRESEFGVNDMRRMVESIRKNPKYAGTEALEGVEAWAIEQSKKIEETTAGDEKSPELQFKHLAGNLERKKKSVSAAEALEKQRDAELLVATENQAKAKKEREERESELQKLREKREELLKKMAAEPKSSGDDTPTAVQIFEKVVKVPKDFQETAGVGDLFGKLDGILQELSKRVKEEWSRTEAIKTPVDEDESLDESMAESSGTAEGGAKAEKEKEKDKDVAWKVFVDGMGADLGGMAGEESRRKLRAAWEASCDAATKRRRRG